MLRYFIFSLFLLLFSCVDLFDPQLPNNEPRLNVEGRITTESDFHWIYLTYDSGYNTETSNFQNLVSKAKIWVTDNLGNRYDFIDDQRKPANFKTAIGYDYRSKDKFQAIIGRTYQLFIQTENGKQYRSKPQVLAAVPRLEKIYSEFEKLPITASSPIGRFMIFTDMQDSPKLDEFYQWETINWERIDYCRIFTIPNEAPSRIYGNPCCQNCYEYTICNECSPIANDRLTNGKPFKQLLATVPFTSIDTYYLRIRQYSISKEVYTFWETLKQQAENTGGLFDVTPQPIRGNMESVSNPQEEVLGVFAVSDVSESVFYFDRNIQNPKPFPPFKPIEVGPCEACREVVNRTATPPLFWDKKKDKF